MTEQTYSLTAQHSEQINEIAKALCALQADIPAIPKSKKGHHGFMYADINDVLKAVLPMLQKHGLSFVQSAEIHGGQPYMMTHLMHPASGQWLKGYARMFFQKADNMGYGAAQTYTRRYGLTCLLGICTEEDTDGVLKHPDVEARERGRQPAAKKATSPTPNIPNMNGPDYDENPF